MPGASAGREIASIISSGSQTVAIMPMKNSAAGTLTRAAAGAQVNVSAQREHDKRNFGAGVGVGDGAAQRAAAAGLHVPDPGQRGGQHPEPLWQTWPMFDVALAHSGTDGYSAGIRVDALQRRHLHHVHQQRRQREPHVQHGQQRLAAGEDACVGAMLVEGFQGSSAETARR